MSRRAWGVVLTAIVFFLAAVLGPASAVGQFCWTIDEQVALVREHGFSARLLDAGQRTRFLAAYNAIEPVSDDQPDQVWFLGHSDGVRGAFVFVEGGCVASYGFIPLRYLEDMARDGVSTRS